MSATFPQGWSAFLAALTGRRVAFALGAAALVAGVLNPIFVTPFAALLGRTLFIAMVLMLVFTAAGQWPRRLPEWLPRWMVQVAALMVAAPAATFAVYMLSVGGNLDEFWQHEGRFTGFILIASSGLVCGMAIGLGAIVRERDAQARSLALAFALEKSTLEKQALDARLSLLHSQIEPHFLFNTLGNVQALVESGSPRAAPVLASLIAYLRAAMPRLAGERATLGDEAALVRAYLELMRMRMPDRLDFDVAIDPELASTAFPPMALLTLVENAVRHGIDPGEQGGRIDVRARRDGERVLVEVTDTGAGMHPNAAPGTGLANLRERLAAFYGGEATLELSEHAPHGVRAAIAWVPRQ
jgi:signal transduction histidine kinase